MKSITIAALATLVSLSLPATAYIDPGSGSAIMSAIIGFFVAIGLAIKTYWYRLKSLITGKTKKSKQAAATHLKAPQNTTANNND